MNTMDVFLPIHVTVTQKEECLRVRFSRHIDFSFSSLYRTYDDGNKQREFNYRQYSDRTWMVVSTVR